MRFRVEMVREIKERGYVKEQCFLKFLWRDNRNIPCAETMSVTRSAIVFATSLLAVPLAYIVNTAQSLHGDFGLLVSGVGSLLIVCFLTYLAVSRAGEPTDPIFYVLTLGMFSSAIDLVIGLENDGYVSGLMSSYLKDGEPYLKTAHGTMICYWDGIGHYLMYIIMLAYMAYHWDFQLIGLYWAGSIGHSILVFIPGNVIGQHDLHWSFLLNVPYILIPFLCGGRFLRERDAKMFKTLTGSANTSQKSEVRIMRKPLDLFFIICLCFFVGLAVFRGLAVLGPNKALFRSYVRGYEPYLLDPNAYPKMQMLVYLFYFLPFYVLAIYELLLPGQGQGHWMANWSVINAGAAAQAQLTYIGGSLHSRTDPSFRISGELNAQLLFWFFNLSLLIIPQFLAWHCLRRISSHKAKSN